MKRIVIIGALALTLPGCAPTVNERMGMVCRGENVTQNERALQRDNWLAPGQHVRCDR